MEINKVEKIDNGKSKVAPTRHFLTKDRQGNYLLLDELSYEKKLIFG